MNKNIVLGAKKSNASKVIFVVVALLLSMLAPSANAVDPLAIPTISSPTYQRNVAITPVGGGASGGTGTYTYSLQGSLTPGLIFTSSTGQISGTPTSSGIWNNLRIQVSDGSTTAITPTFSIFVINGALTLVDGSISTKTFTQNTAITSFGIAASGGTGVYTYSKSGTWPAGIDINPTTGLVTGTPTVTGTFSNLTLSVSDGISTPISTSVFAIVVNPGLVLLSPADRTFSSGTAITPFGPTVSGGTPNYNYAIIAGNLPAGLSLSTNTGLISGIPTTAGTYPNIVIRVTDSSNPVRTATTSPFTITVVTALNITDVTNKAFTVGTAITPFGGTASGGTQNYTYSILSGVLPSGLTLSSTTGLISGIPTSVTPSTSIVIRVVDSSGTSDSTLPFSITVNPALTVTTQPVSRSLPTLTAAAPFGGFVIAGGTSPYTFSVASGTLPAGLSLNTATGQISGTPTLVTGQQSTIVLAATDGAGSRILSNPFVLTMTAPSAITRLNFAAASSKLNLVSKGKLNNLAITIKAAGVTKVIISGHTDKTSTKTARAAIAKKRAQVAEAYLRNLLVGVNLQYIVNGFSARQPVATNLTSSGRAQNRRVDITLE